MEAKLFYVGIELLCLSYVLKYLFKRNIWETNRSVFYLIHVIFWAHVGLMGMGFFLTMKLNKEFNEVIGWNIFLSVLVVIGASVWAILRLRTIGAKEGNPERSSEKQNKWIHRVLCEEREWIDTGFSAIFMASFIMFFIVQAFKIPSGSMRTTLVEGDHLFVNKFIYGIRIPFTYKKVFRFKDIKHKDIIIFRFPSEDKRNRHYGKDFIKRAIGLPGDTIEIKDKVVYRNGRALDEPYTQHVDKRIFRRRPIVVSQEEYRESWENGEFAGIAGDRIRDNFGPVVVPEGHYFAMGDNRDASFDSRFWGPLPFDYLKGEAWVLYWPPKRIKIIR